MIIFLFRCCCIFDVISACLCRIRSRVVEPYNKIVTRTMQLRRLQVSSGTHQVTS